MKPAATRMTSTALVPRVPPPPPTSFQSMSHYDRLTCLLSMQDDTVKERTDVESQIRQLVKSAPPPKRSATARLNACSTLDEVSLFGGAITHRKRSASSELKGSTKETTNQRNEKNAKCDGPAPHPFFSKPLKAQNLENNRFGPATVVTGNSCDSTPTPPSMKRPKTIGLSVKEKGTKHFSVAERDFQGLAMLCHNAGGRLSGLDHLIEECSRKDATICMTMICADEHLSSNLDNTLVKYCTPSVKCTGCSWACDRAPRVMKARGKMLGAVIMIPEAEEKCFFLPLMDCMKDKASEALRPESEKLLPLRCETSLAARWEAVRRIVEGPALKIIILLLALLHHAVPNSKEKQVQPLNVVDPRVAKFMCGNDASVADIELQSIIQSFLQTEGGSCTTSIEVDDSQMHAMGRISRKVHVQLSLLRKLIPAYECLRRNLIETQSWNVFKDLEMPLVSVLTHMEFWGVAISLKALNCSADKLKSFMRHIEERVVGLVGEHRGQLNLQSPEQVARLLYEELQLPRPAATSKSRHSSTSEKELNKLVHLHPVVDLILMYRSAAKVAGTYIDGVRPFILSVSDNSNIHACFNQTIASTGRLSCSRPNLQSIPKDCLDVARECALGSEVITESRISPRDFFLARSNCCLLSIDYSQIEMRIMAQVSGDVALRQLFTSSGDVYVLLASSIFSKDCSLINPQERNQAKVICLGVIYGMGAKMAAERLQIDVCKVYTITSAFFAKYKGLKNWISFVKKEATKQGYVSTIFGRRRYLPEIHSPDLQGKAKAERQAVNTVIQGSASDLLKHVMLRVECLLNEAYSTSEADTTHCDPRSLRPRLLMQVHDELIYEIPLYESSNENYSLDSNVLNFIPLVTRYMNSTVVDELGFHVPLEVNTTIGLVWGRMRKFSDSCQLEKCNTETPCLKRIPVAAAEVKLDKELSSTLIGKRSVD